MGEGQVHLDAQQGHMDGRSTTYTAPCLAKAINGSNQMAGSAIAARVKLYAKNQSDSVPPINAQNPELGWSEDLPQWSNGYFVWSMERVTYGDGSVTHTRRCWRPRTTRPTRARTT